MGLRRLVIVAALLGGPAWGDGEPPAPAAVEPAAAPARAVLAFDIAVDGKLTVDAAGGPMRLGSLSGSTPSGDALEAVRLVLRAAAAGRRAGGADGLSGVTMTVRVHPTVRWRPVEWLVRVARESEDRPGRLHLVVREPYGRAHGIPFRAPAAPAGAVRAVLSRAQGKDAGASLLVIGNGRWVLPPLAQHAGKRAQRLSEATDAADTALRALPGGIVEVEVKPDAAALTPVVDVLDTLALFARVRPTPVEFVFDPSPLPGRSDKPASDVPAAAFASLPAMEPFDAFPSRRRSPRADEGEAPAARAVAEALRWLAAHQAPDGRWGAESFAAWSDGKPVHRTERPDGLGNPAHDVGVSGLALCAFLGAGYTDRGEGAHATTVRRGLARLLLSQGSDGSFADVQRGEAIYDHATAALAVVEAYGMTGDTVLRGAAQKALDFVALARNPYFAWRHGVKPGDNDTSVTAWMAAVIRSASLANEEAARRGDPPLVLDWQAADGLRAWIDKMTDPDYGRVGFVTRGSGPFRPPALVDRFPPDKSEAMTAAGFNIRLGLGEDPRTSEPMMRGLDLMARLLPTWNTLDGSIDLVYWYWGSLAMFQAGGDRWKRWSDALQGSVVANQRLDTDHALYRGSWDPVDVWGREGGRVYSTAMGALILETPTRYERVFPAK